VTYISGASFRRSCGHVLGAWTPSPLLSIGHPRFLRTISSSFLFHLSTPAPVALSDRPSISTSLYIGTDARRAVLPVIGLVDDIVAKASACDPARRAHGVRERGHYRRTGRHTRVPVRLPAAITKSSTSTAASFAFTSAASANAMTDIATRTTKASRVFAALARIFHCVRIFRQVCAQTLTAAVQQYTVHKIVSQATYRRCHWATAGSCFSLSRQPDFFARSNVVATPSGEPTPIPDFVWTQASS
jgi:hypothetical protein